jgi:hypothetical protein
MAAKKKAAKKKVAKKKVAKTKKYARLRTWHVLRGLVGDAGQSPIAEGSSPDPGGCQGCDARRS